MSIEGLSPEAAAAVVKLSRGMANSKDMEDRLTFYNLAKKNDPTISVPPDVQIEQFKREQAAKDQDREIETRKQKMLRQQEDQRRGLIESGRYNEDTVKKIEEEIMTPRGIADYDIAATLYAHANPEPSVHAPERHASGASWTMPWMAQGAKSEETKALLANPRKAALDKAHQVVTELRRQRA